MVEGDVSARRDMKRFLDPDLIARTYRDPLSLLILVVDLLPIFAVIFYGWSATPLVALYWLENLIIGVFTILRILANALSNRASLALSLFLIPFFFFHYGLFCFVHGIFLHVFAGIAETGGDAGAETPVGLVNWALSSGEGMIFFVLAIIGINAVLYATDFIGKGQFRDTNPMAEMFAPYGRIVTLHVAIILGAFLTLALGQPLTAVLFLILLRVVFGMVFSILRRERLVKSNPLPNLDSLRSS